MRLTQPAGAWVRDGPVVHDITHICKDESDRMTKGVVRYCSLTLISFKNL